MQFPLGSTFSEFFFVASVVVLAWTAVAQGAAIGAERARIDMIDISTDGLSRRVNTPVDDSWYTLAASKREEELAKRNGDLSRRVNVPVDDTAWYTAIELSASTERDLSRRQRTETIDTWYTLTDIETRKTERDDLARQVDSPMDDRDLWYTLRERGE